MTNTRINFNEYDYITKSLTEPNERLLLATAAVNPDFKNHDCIGRTIECVGYATRQVDFIEANNTKTVTNCILIDADGNSYSTIAAGITKVVDSWKSAGLEPDWDSPFKVEYIEQVNGRYRYYSLKPVNNRRR